ncbi:MAG: hypothetical protein KGZ68_10975 [Dechloromonas sp.]|nr:hypothetical protein [Dechloromonas sp.]
MIERIAYRFKSGRLVIITIERKPSRMVRRARARAKAARLRWRPAA